MQPLHDERLWTQALRHIFAMTIDECATWIAQTGDSESWRQWENGKCAIPDRVVEQLLAMRQQRKNIFMPS